MKNQKAKAKKHQRGVALMFSLGILGLMAVLAMTFASLSITSQQTSANASSDSAARLMARTALNRAYYVLQKDAYKFDADKQEYIGGSIRSDEIVSGGDGEYIASGIKNYNRNDFDYLWMLAPDILPWSKLGEDKYKEPTLADGLDTGCHTDFLRAIRYRVLDKYARVPGFEKYYLNKFETSDIKDANYCDVSGNANRAATTTELSIQDTALRTTPFWQYFRNPVDNSITGRFAYLAHRPHGLLDPVIYGETRRRLGLHPAELYEKIDDLTALENGSAVNSVYGRWSGLTSANLPDTKNYHIGGDFLSSLKKSGVSPVSDSTPNESKFSYQELAYNNLVNKWFKVPRKPTPDYFWYAIDGTTPQRYWRFNLNRTKASWDALTVFDIVAGTDDKMKENLKVYDPSVLTTNSSSVHANDTKCIPWFSVRSGDTNDVKKRRCQVAANFLARFRRSPIASDGEVAETAENIVTKGIWGKISFLNSTDASSYKDQIIDSPDWTGNMRTPYILDVALKVKTTINFYGTSKTDNSDPANQFKYLENHTLSMFFKPELYVAVIDFFDTKDFSDNTLKFRLPGYYTASPVKPKLSFSVPTSVTNALKIDEYEFPHPDSSILEPWSCTLASYPGSSETTGKLYDGVLCGSFTSQEDAPIPYKIKIFHIDLTGGVGAISAYNTEWNSGSYGFDQARAQNFQTITVEIPIGDQSVKLKNLQVGLFSQDGVPYDFAKVLGEGKEQDMQPFTPSPGVTKKMTITVDAPTAEPFVFSRLLFFRTKDVTCNLNADDWKNYTKDNVPTVTDPDDTFTFSGGTFTDWITAPNPDFLPAADSKGSGTDDSTDDFRLPTASSGKDSFRTQLPVYDSSSFNAMTYPIPHPWEIGMISRGECFRTLNLTRFNDLDSGTEAVNGISAKDGIDRIYFAQRGMPITSGNGYSKGDANILDQIMVTAKPKGDDDPFESVDHYGKLDINEISYMNEPDYGSCSDSDYKNRFKYPNRGNLFAARPYFRGIVLTGTPAGLSSDSLNSSDAFLDGKGSTSYISETVIQTILEAIASYNTNVTDFYQDRSESDWKNVTNKVKKYMFHSRAELLRKFGSNDEPKKSLDSLLLPMQNAFLQGASDAAKEEFFCKVVMLLTAGEVTSAQPDNSLIVLGIAQTIRDDSRSNIPLDLKKDGSYSVASLVTNSAVTPVTGGLNDRGGPYRNRGKVWSDTNFEGWPLIHKDLGYPVQISVSGSGTSAKLVLSTSSVSGINPIGYYQPGFDSITGTCKVIGWLWKDPSGKWKIERIKHVD